MDKPDTPADGDTTTRLQDVRQSVATTLHAVGRLCVDWVDRRSRLSQLAVGAVIASGLEAAIPLVQQLSRVTLTALGSVSVSTWVVVLVGVQLGQTVIQTRKLDILGGITKSMQPDTETDGGRPSRSWRSGGGILGGAIVGLGIGSSYGTRGVFVGIVVGAVLGDTFEEWTVAP